MFQEKAALKAHMETHGSGGFSLSIPDFRLRDRLQGAMKTSGDNPILIIFSAVLMSTLFLGTVQFASSVGGGGGQGGGGGDTAQYRNPRTGYSSDTLPARADTELTERYAYQEPLSPDAQLHVLYRGSTQDGPAVLLQYPRRAVDAETVETIQSVGRQFRGYVYVSRLESGESVTMTSFRTTRTFDAFTAADAERFICDTYRGLRPRLRPLACDIGGGNTSGG